MPGLGRKTFTAGDVLAAADVQGYLMDQTVMKFASSAARTATLGTATSTGMVTYRTDGTAVEYFNGTSWVALGEVTQTGTQTLTNKTLTSPVLGGAAIENAYIAAAFAGYTFYATTNGAVQHCWGGNATANGTLNITSTAGQTLNTLMSVNQSITVTLSINNGATAYYPNAITIDGSAPSIIKWAGGTAPTSGNANEIDVYTFTITKTGTPNWWVLASQTKF